MARHPRHLTGRRALTFVWALLLASGCTPKRIPGTNIEDNPDDRAILNVLERYRSALEAKDVPAILDLVSPGFHDNGGTSDPDDDLDYASLARRLPARLARVQDIRVDMDVRSIDLSHDREKADAVFYYTTHFRLPGLTSRPQSESDLKEMTLHKEGGRWKIVSGV